MEGALGRSSLRAGVRGAAVLAKIGLACGVIYAFGGLIYDLATVGLNQGTALAFLALVGMPALGAALGFVLGAAGQAILGWLRAAPEGPGAG